MKRVHSLSELKGAIQESALAEGLVLSEAGRFGEAVVLLDAIKDFSGIDTKSRTHIKNSYYASGKQAQHERKLGEALRYCSRAREVCPDDALLLERVKLLNAYRKYWNADNIAEFRRHFGLGFTSGGYATIPHPFVEIASESGIIQEPLTSVRRVYLDDVRTLGVYRTAAQGRHLLSRKIREYKKGESSLASPFAWLLADFIFGRTTFVKSVDLIVPSPSNPNKHLVRGFIPSLLIGKELSKCLAIPYRELFYVQPMDHRFRDLPYDEAKELVKYKDDKIEKSVTGNQVLLLDDVFTSGRTMNLLADILKSSGATTVYGMALAKTGPAKRGD